MENVFINYQEAKEFIENKIKEVCEKECKIVEEVIYFVAFCMCLVP